jgi:hypothetical protein
MSGPYRPPYRTCALLGLVIGLVAAGYFFAPAPSESMPLRPQVMSREAPAPSASHAPVAQAQAAVEPKPTAKPAFVSNRAPVPLVTQRHTTYFPVDEKVASKTLARDPNDKTQALSMSAVEGESQARRAVEIDGYKQVRGLVKRPDGSWSGRAMRGNTEITVRVAADGSVSAD